MTTRSSARHRLVAAALALVLIALLPVTASRVSRVRAAQPGTLVEVYAEGLINPKGIAFMPDGSLYVAESGAPGDVLVPLPVNFGGEGPIGTNGRISRIPPTGHREDFVTGLPNIGLYGGAEMLGPTGLAVMDGELYELAAGHMTVSPTLSHVASDGTLTAIADIGAFNDANPALDSNGDAVPMGNPFDVVALGGQFYSTDGNYNRVIGATLGGQMRILAGWEDSPVTVGATAGPDGNLYVCQFSPRPYFTGTGRIDRVTPAGEVTEGVVTDLTTPIDAAFAPDGTLYVLQYAAEFSEELQRYMPYGGEVRRALDDGSTSSVVTNLVFPTSMTFGPDGALYVTNYGNLSNEGQGQVLRIVPGTGTGVAPAVPTPDESRLPPTATPGGTATATVPPTPSVSIASEVVVEIVDGGAFETWGYDPAEITIQTGQAVTFLNSGRTPHTATANGGAFDTQILKNGESYTVPFTQSGVYDYYCIPHPRMVGRVVVEGQGGPASTAVPAALTSEPNPPDVNVWYAIAFVGLIIGALFAVGFALRRPRASAPEPPTAEEPHSP